MGAAGGGEAVNKNSNIRPHSQLSVFLCPRIFIALADFYSFDYRVKLPATKGKNIYGVGGIFYYTEDI